MSRKETRQDPYITVCILCMLVTRFVKIVRRPLKRVDNGFMARQGIRLAAQGCIDHVFDADN